jgi:hypothetical protein
MAGEARAPGQDEGARGQYIDAGGVKIWFDAWARRRLWCSFTATSRETAPGSRWSRRWPSASGSLLLSSGATGTRRTGRESSRTGCSPMTRSRFWRLSQKGRPTWSDGAVGGRGTHRRVEAARPGPQDRGNLGEPRQHIVRGSAVGGRPPVDDRRRSRGRLHEGHVRVRVSGWSRSCTIENGVRNDNRRANLELWTCGQPSGIRAEDAITWALEVLRRYRGGSPPTVLKRTALSTLGGGGNRTRVLGRPSGSSTGVAGGSFSPQGSHRRRTPRPAWLRCPAAATRRNRCREPARDARPADAGDPRRTAT